MTLESSKNIGGIGAILLFIGVIAFFVQPLITVGLGIIGAIMILVALHGLADYYRERGIFNNALYGFIALIVGGVVTFVSFVYLLLYTSFLTDLVSLIYPGFNGDWTSLPSLTPNTNVDPSSVVPFIVPILGILAIAWIFSIIASFFTWRSLKTVSSKAAIGLFSTGGILLLIGAFLAIVLIGIVLMWIAMLLIAIAFFQLKPLPEQPVAASPAPPPPPAPTI